MRPTLFWLLVLTLVVSLVPLGTAASDGAELSVRAISYRAIPHESTLYVNLPGSMNTSCYGSGTEWNYLTTISVNCKTVGTPPATIPVSIRSIEVYNLLEANGRLYTVVCTARRIGDTCTWLMPGNTFEASLANWTIRIKTRGFGNTGKERWFKYRLLDARAQASTPANANPELSGSYSGIVRNSSAGVSAHFAIAIREENGTIFGCIDIQKPLYGTGALQGRVQGSQVSFDSIGSVFPVRFQIHFRGEWQGGDFHGTYDVTEPGQQTGEFDLARQSSDAPESGFDLKQCVRRLAAY